MSFALYISVTIGLLIFMVFMMGVVGEDYDYVMVALLFSIAVLWPLCIIAACVIIPIGLVLYVPYWLGSKI